MRKIKIYCDGACKSNPGHGGWGAVIKNNDAVVEIYGGEPNTTNNRMELMAAIKALESIKTPCKIEVFSDSRYLVDGATKWIYGWIRKNWISSTKEPVKNRDLWELLDTQIKKHSIEWHWIKGHNGHIENERADYLANKGIY